MVPADIGIRSDESVVRQILGGERDAFQVLVDRHLPAVYSTALAHSRDPFDAEDTVQEAFLRAFTGLDTLRAPGAFRGWVLTITRNLALGQLRRKRVAPLDALRPTAAESPATAAQRQERFALLDDAIGRLRDAERETIRLHYFSELSTQEIANSLGVSRSAVLKRLERARRHLEEQLLSRMEESETRADIVTHYGARIAKVITAASAAWEFRVVAASAIATKASAPTTSAGVASVTMLAALLMLYVAGWRFVEDRDRPLVVEASVNTAILDTPPERSIGMIDNGSSPAPAGRLVVKVNTIDTEAEPAARPAVEIRRKLAYSRLDGVWELRLIMAGVDRGTFRMHFTEFGNDVQLIPESPMWGSLIRSATIVGNRLEVAILDPDSDIVIGGEFNESRTRMTLTGALLPYGDGSPWLQEGVPSVQVTIQGHRISGEDVAVEGAKRIFENIFKLVVQYANDHDGTSPPTLKHLIRGYATEPDTVKLIREGELAYESSTVVSETPVLSASLNEKNPDVLLWMEHHLTKQWGDCFLNPVPILVGSFLDIGVTLELNSNGVVGNRSDFHRARPTEAATDEQKLVWNAECSQNILALDAARWEFTEDQAFGLMPPGWRVLFPHYFSDTALLTCPSVDPGIESYRLLFPATLVSSLVRVDEESEDSDLLALQRGIPIIIETHDCSNSGSRHVVFLDGHVERVPDVDWDFVVGRYLDCPLQ